MIYPLQAIFNFDPNISFKYNKVHSKNEKPITSSIYDVMIRVHVSEFLSPMTFAPIVTAHSE